MIWGYKQMSEKKLRIFACDFETTVYENQEYTEVWASACLEFDYDKIIGEPIVFKSIREQFSYFSSLKTNIVAYYHNLKFDGSFWLSYLMTVENMKLASKTVVDEFGEREKFVKNSDMASNTFKVTISELGQWYTITIKKNNRIIELRDSLKLLPFSLRKIGKDFKTNHQKLEMKYEGVRYSGCDITDEEMEYIKNDVYVLAEALLMMFKEKHDKLTIGSCCLSEYQRIIGKKTYKRLFPDLTTVELNPERYKYKNADEYIRRAYRGGWCYLKPEKANKIIKGGCTVDVNSLYPSVMISESGNTYPVGYPTFWHGNYIPEGIINNENYYYFIRIKTRFYLRKGFLPFIQIKHNFRFDGTENLITSDFYDWRKEKFFQYYYDMFGNLQDTRVELTLSGIDYELIKKHYILEDFEILDGCYFTAKIGLFDEYIHKYAKIKQENKGAKRTLAKLMLNNLYGKLSSNANSSYKIPYVNADGIVKFYSVTEHEKKAGHIACGSAVTSYARRFTITHAQENYSNFIYADTDSLHCNCNVNDLKNIKLHDTAFLAWKCENLFDNAIFVRQKSYIEHVTHEDLKPVEKPYYNIKCAGMPERSKKLLNMSLTGEKINNGEYSEQAIEFVKIKRTLQDFKIGLQVPAKLTPVTIKGGVILCETDFTFRDRECRNKKLST